MKPISLLIISLVLVISIFAGFGLATNSLSNDNSNGGSGLFGMFFQKGSNSDVIQTSCGGVSCPLPNSLTNVTA